MGNYICDLLCGIFCDRDQIFLEKEVSKSQFSVQTKIAFYHHF